MAVEMRSVFSSHIDSIGYNPDTRDLVVKWKKGRLSAYAEVTPDKARSVINAPSVGEAISEFVKPFHSHRYLG